MQLNNTGIVNVLSLLQLQKNGYHVTHDTIEEWVVITSKRFPQVQAWNGFLYATPYQNLYKSLKSAEKEIWKRKQRKPLNLTSMVTFVIFVFGNYNLLIEPRKSLVEGYVFPNLQFFPVPFLRPHHFWLTWLIKKYSNSISFFPLFMIIIPNIIFHDKTSC